MDVNGVNPVNGVSAANSAPVNGVNASMASVGGKTRRILVVMRLHHENATSAGSDSLLQKGKTKGKGKNGARGNGPTRKGRPRANRARHRNLDPSGLNCCRFGL
jgi:hypothetical protein